MMVTKFEPMRSIYPAQFSWVQSRSTSNSYPSIHPEFPIRKFPVRAFSSRARESMERRGFYCSRAWIQLLLLFLSEKPSIWFMSGETILEHTNILILSTNILENFNFQFHQFDQNIYIPFVPLNSLTEIWYGKWHVSATLYFMISDVVVSINTNVQFHDLQMCTLRGGRTLQWGWVKWVARGITGLCSATMLRRINRRRRLSRVLRLLTWKLWVPLLYLFGQ